MFRLIVALGVATALWPAQAITPSAEIQNQQIHKEVTTFDALNAAQSLYSDVTSFCDRNAKTCDTTKALASSAVQSIKGGINNLAKNTVEAEDKTNVEDIKTGSIQK